MTETPPTTATTDNLNAGAASVKRMVSRRFHELAVKEAIGTITPMEMAKLERYGNLLRPEPTPREISIRARNDWKFRNIIKALRRCELKAANAEVSHAADSTKPKS